MPTIMPAALALMMLGTMALMSFGFRKMTLNFCAMQLVTICDSAWVSPFASKVYMSKPYCDSELQELLRREGLGFVGGV
jgi:hypothetical protein